MTVVGMLAGVVMLGTAGWACTAYYVGVNPLSVNSGAPGAKLAVSGYLDRYVPSDGMVEVRWDALEGPVLAGALPHGDMGGMRFEADVTIPQAPPGVHYLVVRSGERGMARAAFEVTSDPTAKVGSATQPARLQPWRSHASPDSTQMPSGRSSTALAGLLLLGMGTLALAVGTIMMMPRRQPVAVRRAP